MFSYLSKLSVRVAQPVLDFQMASFSKYISKSRTKRLPLTTKRAGKGFYKGNGARKEGVINSKGESCTNYYRLS